MMEFGEILQQFLIFSRAKEYVNLLYLDTEVLLCKM